jgi:hypothetical protein
MYFRLCKICFIFATRKWTDLTPFIKRKGLQPRKKVLIPMLLFTTIPQKSPARLFHVNFLKSLYAIFIYL